MKFQQAIHPNQFLQKVNFLIYNSDGTIYWPIHKGSSNPNPDGNRTEHYDVFASGDVLANLLNLNINTTNGTAADWEEKHLDKAIANQDRAADGDGRITRGGSTASQHNISRDLSVGLLAHWLNENAFIRRSAIPASTSTDHTVTFTQPTGGTISAVRDDTSAAVTSGDAIPDGTDITFTIGLGIGSTFDGWDDDCVARGTTTTCNLNLYRDIEVSADVTPPAPTLNVPDTSFTIGAASGQTVSVPFTANGTPTVSESISWLSVSVGSDSLTLTTDEANPTTSERQETFTLTHGSNTETITVTQTGSAPTLTVGSRAVTIGAGNGATTTTTVIANGSVSVSSGETWLTATESSGTITFTTTEANPTTSTREATVTVSNGGQSTTITVTQTGSNPNLSVDPTSLTFVAAGEAKTADVTANGAFTVSDDADWVSTSESGNTITITATNSTGLVSNNNVGVAPACVT